jgi:uncharacterized protein YebE (UPF0316 family)
MEWADLAQSYWFQTLVFPLLIFLARVADVSLGTLRMVFVSRGEKGRAAFTGFFEVLIWLTAITYILQNLTHVSNYLAYAAGFATGNYLGLKLEEKLALGLLSVMVITNHDARSLVEHLKEHKYGITSVSAVGSTGRVRVLISVIRRKNLEELRQIVERFHPNAFMAVQAVKSVTKPVYPAPEPHRTPSDLLLWWRKAK